MDNTAITKDFDKILGTEYLECFDEIRKKMMLMSYYKYGSIKDNYQKFKCMDAIGNIEKRLKKYRLPTESGSCELAGFSIGELRRGTNL